MHLHHLFKLSLVFCTFAYGSKTSPINTASNIVIGDVLSSTVGFAGGLVPITETKIVVKRVLKDINSSLGTNDTIKLINYGGVINEKEYFLEGEEGFFLNDNRKVILCLKKYFNHFKIEDPSALESVAYIVEDKVYGYDTLSLADSTAESVYKRNIAKANFARKKKITANIEVQADKKKNPVYLKAQSARIKLTDYISNYLEDDIKNSDITSIQDAPIVARVSVVSIDTKSSSPYYHIYKFNVSNIVKGTLGKGLANGFLTMPIPAHNNNLPQLKDKGYLLLDGPQALYPTANFFLKLTNGTIVNSGKQTADYIKKIEKK